MATTSTAYSGAYGGVPAPADPQSAQDAAISGNLGNIANLYNLATGVGSASGAGGAANLNTALPGATAALGTGLNLANSELGGQIDQPTINNLEQVAAERGVSTGSISSPNSNAALMQALGRTTQGTEQLGMSNLSSLISAAPVGPQFNPNTQLIDPNTQLEQQNYNNALAAAPNPAAAGAANLAALKAGTSAGVSAGTAPKALGGGSSFGAPVSTAGGGTGSWGGIVYGPQGGSVTGGNGAMDYFNNGQPKIANGQNDNGASAYQQEYGGTLPPGTSYDPSSGLVMNENEGVAYDPYTGLSYDAYTGEVIGDEGSGGTQGYDSEAGYVDTGASSDYYGGSGYDGGDSGE